MYNSQNRFIIMKNLIYIQNILFALFKEKILSIITKNEIDNI